ncbi:abnormal spindle-like microcephaly-associated protein [Dioscorea alata]|uniref:Abnormal spindle-like microcephaly-associated protein n=1 Tax=Dioscorea alata TaxID=55571 RepID=A0ACB7VN40_DIOAL|nr:abnormal spindle-like microcephaly-associated protein [Dioscorea alata]
MDRRRRPEWPEPEASSSSPPNASPFLRDLSNYMTPRTHFPNPNPIPSPIFFTASKNTPSSTFATSSSRRRPFSSASRSNTAAARRLKALELDQSRSARKGQTRREKSVKSLSRSISAWLNFLFRNPQSCGSNLNLDGCSGRQNLGFTPNRKRENLDRGFEGMEIGRRRWRSPKRQRSCDDVARASALPTPRRFLALEKSLSDVCSFQDMEERMLGYMSERSCDEVFSMMSHVCKNIDEGRLKMKSHCPIVTDLGLKKKATDVLMCYNPVWLQIGLHIVFGGDSLLNEGERSEQHDMFLKMIIEKQFFSHLGVAKHYSYNKLIGGLYRPGYFEALGSVILKRFLLLVISLDRAKCESTLPLRYGIDGIDGGSPLLFHRHSHIKSSQQIIKEFLHEAMHGEGDLLAHLAIVGCKVKHQQPPLSDYDFTVTNLFEDIQDGILLCRAIQLLKCDASILSKVVVPSDTSKKKLHNCNVAMTYLKQADVPLVDTDGVVVVAEDVASGDKELTLSILWNIFVHLQVPMLVHRSSLTEEISKIKGIDLRGSNFERDTGFCLLLEWIQAVCEEYNVKIDNFSSLNDGKALRCLVDYYFKILLNGHHPLKDEHLKPLFNLLDSDDNSALHNFLLVQQVVIMSGKFREVLQASDILDQDAFFDERSMIILLVFLAAELIHRRNLSPDLNLLGTPCSLLPSDVPDLSSNNVLEFDSPREKDGLNLTKRKEWAALVIQSQFKRFHEQKKYLKIKRATSLLQNAIRAWLVVIFRSSSHECVCTLNPSPGVIDEHFKYLMDRHRFIRLKKSALLIQRAVRVWIKRKHQKKIRALKITKSADVVLAVTYLQAYIRGWISRSRFLGLLEVQHQCRAAIKIQAAWRSYIVRAFYLQKKSAAAIVQKHWRAWYLRRQFMHQVGAIIQIQACIRSALNQITYKRNKASASEIQRFIRGQIARNKFSGALNSFSSRQHQESYDVIDKGPTQDLELKEPLHIVLKLQRWWRQILSQKSQSQSAILIQSYIRGWNAREKAKRRCSSIYMIQRWWRRVLYRASRKRSAVTIQTYVRGWIARREANRIGHCIIVIQSYWKGYLVRKHPRQQILDLCCKLKRSAANVDDDMRLINRLVTALSELLGYKSISNIRHTCATLDMATAHSEKCCETLVAAGAINILLKQFHSLNRSVPDQEVLKHVLSILRNIASFPHLADALIKTPQTVEIIFQELLRNKSEGFFIASDIMKKLCGVREGLLAVSKLQGHVKRLNGQCQDLGRKSELIKRTPRLGAGREVTLLRLKEVQNLLHLIYEDQV